MKIKYLGHACFVITSDTGIRIITDPYETSEILTYGEITEAADAVTVSHDHFDHNNVAAIRGNPKVAKGTTKVKGMEFQGIPTYHDNTGGKQRGKNTIFCFYVDGIRVCHLGDLGHWLSDSQVAELGEVDILLIPVGGNYTIDAKIATAVYNQIKPKVVIPMHFRTEKSFPEIAGIGDFMQEKTNVSQLDTSEIEFIEGKLPKSTQIIVLKPAL